MGSRRPQSTLGLVVLPSRQGPPLPAAPRRLPLPAGPSARRGTPAGRAPAPNHRSRCAPLRAAAFRFLRAAPLGACSPPALFTTASALFPRRSARRPGWGATPRRRRKGGLGDSGAGRAGGGAGGRRRRSGRAPRRAGGREGGGGSCSARGKVRGRGGGREQQRGRLQPQVSGGGGGRRGPPGARGRWRWAARGLPPQPRGPWLAPAPPGRRSPGRSLSAGPRPPPGRPAPPVAGGPEPGRPRAVGGGGGGRRREPGLEAGEGGPVSGSRCWGKPGIPPRGSAAVGVP